LKHHKANVHIKCRKKKASFPRHAATCKHFKQPQATPLPHPSLANHSS